MEPDTATTTVIALPEFPPGHRVSATKDGIGFRPFGLLEKDLAVDFNTRNRARLATRLLEMCAVDRNGVLPEDFFRELSVGKRIECLLVLATGARDAVMGFTFKCSGCSEELEFELTLDEISSMQSAADRKDTVVVRIGGRPIEFRKVSGRDQEAWDSEVFTDEVEAATSMIGTLALEPHSVEELGPDDVSSVDEAMDDADPLVNFSCRIGCDECGESYDHEVDLFETALSMLQRAQERLVVTVHRLASHYHWSEGEIFEVPAGRRQAYLELIGKTKK